MNAGQPGMEKSRSIDDQHLLRLMALLDDLVGKNAASRSTAHLDVDHRTLTARRRKGSPGVCGWCRTGHRWPGDVSEVAGRGEGRRLS